MEHLSGFAPLADRYNGFVLDLWGVIHDGVNAFPHAVETLTQLRAAGKRTLLLSNVPRPNDAVRTMMRRMGIEDTLYTGILTSGEAVRLALQNSPDIWWAQLGSRVFHLGPDRDKPVLEGLPLPGMVDQAVAEHHFDPAQAFMIGDKEVDVELGQAVGAATFLVRTGHGAKHVDGTKADHVVADLAEAVAIIEKSVAA